jgi:hypothetical protein
MCKLLENLAFDHLRRGGVKGVSRIYFGVRFG